MKCSNIIIINYYFTVIIDGPDSVNAVEGTTVQFSCVVEFSGMGTREVAFFVNDTATNNPCIIKAGFIASAVDILNNTQRLNLTATALSQYNNTEVLCRGLKSFTLPALSEVAVLLVQGKLLTTYSHITT